MPQEIILPSKRRVDIHGILAPFDQLLQSGESIDSCSCKVKVFSGVDPNPDDMIVGPAHVRGAGVYQDIKLGIPGVIYKLIFQAITDLGNEYFVEATLAVLENNLPPGPIYQTMRFSSPPYPYDFIEAMEGVSDFTSGVEIMWPIEAFDAGSDILSGSLRAILIQYSMDPEAFDTACTLDSGSLRQILISYDIPPEAFDGQCVITKGFLFGVAISYTNYPPEAFDSTSNIISGSLT